jgi:hypothetical protein
MLCRRMIPQDEAYDLPILRASGASQALKGYASLPKLCCNRTPPKNREQSYRVSFIYYLQSAPSEVVPRRQGRNLVRQFGPRTA